jgi:hypothetical protein
MLDFQKRVKPVHFHQLDGQYIYTYAQEAIADEANELAACMRVNGWTNASMADGRT